MLVKKEWKSSGRVLLSLGKRAKGAVVIHPTAFELQQEVG